MYIIFGFNDFMITKHVLIMQKYKYKLIRQKCYYKNQFFFYS